MNIKDFLKVMEKANKWDHNINYGENPLLYHYAPDCSGMYVCSPYREELLGIWKFSSKSVAKQSAKDIYNLFLKYLDLEDFVGCDIARKYLQAGFQKKSIPHQFHAFFENFYIKVVSNKSYDLLKEDFLKKQKDFRLKNKNEKR